MHELSIAMSLVDFANREAEKAGWERISKVHLEIGPLSGVVPEALESAFGIAAADSVLDHAQLVIKNVPIIILCKTCDAEKTIGSRYDLSCPDCGAPASDVVGGRELEVTAFEVHSNGSVNGSAP